MNNFHILASGSKANCYILETSQEAVIVDQGLSYRKFCVSCKNLGIDTGKITSIVVTHEHSDHIKGVPLTAEKLGVPVYTTEGTATPLKKKDKYGIDIVPLEKEKKFSTGGIEFIPFPLMHDAADPVGFCFHLENNKKLSISTDTGVVTSHILRHISESNYLVLESNHDRGMLNSNTKYPQWLKTRVKSPRGHLSNTQCMDVLRRIQSCRLKNIVFSHLSENNNDPEIVKSLANGTIRENSLVCEPFIAMQEKAFSMLLT